MGANRYSGAEVVSLHVRYVSTVSRSEPETMFLIVSRLVLTYLLSSVSALFPNIAQKHCFLVFLKAPPTVSDM